MTALSFGAGVAVGLIVGFFIDLSLVDKIVDYVLHKKEE